MVSLSTHTAQERQYTRAVLLVVLLLVLTSGIQSAVATVAADENAVAAVDTTPTTLNGAAGVAVGSNAILPGNSNDNNNSNSEDEIASSLAPLPSSPLPSICTDGSVLAIGDLHGDVYKLQQLLAAAGVVTTPGFHWRRGCRTTVVQLGDMADRGRHPHTLYEFAAMLESEAAADGGEFTFIIGNHELMSLLGQVAYVNPILFSDVFDGEAGFKAAFAPTGCYGKYILEHPVVLVRRGIVFVHGGLTVPYAEVGIDAINRQFKAGFDATTTAAELATPEAKTTVTSHLYESSNSPLWDRSVLSEALLNNNCKPLHTALEALSHAEGVPVHTMVVGHTPLPDGTPRTDLCGGALIAVDVGLSEAMFTALTTGATHATPYGFGAMVRLSTTADNAALRAAAIVAPWGLGRKLTTPVRAQRDRPAQAAWCRETSPRVGEVLQETSRQHESTSSVPRRATPVKQGDTHAHAGPATDPQPAMPFTKVEETHYGRYTLGLAAIVLLLLTPYSTRLCSIYSRRWRFKKSRKSKSNKRVTFALPGDNSPMATV